MHDPKAYLDNLFVQEQAKFQYAHEKQPNDSIYRVAIEFQEALRKTTDPDVKSHVFKYQKDLKESVLHFRKVKLAIEENLQRKNIEKEAKDKVVRFVAALSAQSKDKGKAILETPMRTQPSQMLETIHKGAEFKRYLENLSSQLQTWT